jgi:signal transduction histidine kinase
MPVDAHKWASALSYGLDPFCSFRLVNKHSGKSLGLAEGAITNGSMVSQWSATASSSQQWLVVPTEDGEHYEILSRASGKCASVYQDSMSVGARLWVWDYGDDPSQQFDLVNAGAGWFKFKSVRTGLILEVAEASTGDNAVVQQGADSGAANQLWRFCPFQDAALACEDFNYPVGDLNWQNGGIGWNGGWINDGPSTARVAKGSLIGGAHVPPGYDARSSGNSAFIPNGERVGRYLDCSVDGNFNIHGYLNADGRIGRDGTTLYVSFLQQPSQTSLFYEFELNRSSRSAQHWTPADRIAGVGNDTSGDTVNLRAPAESFTAIGRGTTNANLYVLRIDFKPGNDDVRVYRNPTSETEPARPDLTLLGLADLSFDRISLAAFANGNTVKFDQIRMAASWRCALGPAPEFIVQSASNLVAYDAFRRATVSAHVLGGHDNLYYLLDGDTGLRVQLRQPVKLEPGDIVEIAGMFLNKDQFVNMIDVTVQRTGRARLPPARPLSSLSACGQTPWVSMEGILTGVKDDGREKSLQMHTGPKDFAARFPFGGFSGPVPWAAGSRLKLTGVYVRSPELPGNDENENSFELLLNSPAAIELIARPPWWTLRRVMIVLGVLAAGLALTLVWVRLLRRQVAQHALRLQREILERERVEQARIIEGERARISRDLHDDLGGILTQINMLATFPSGEKSERMQLIADKSHHMIAALDQVVWMTSPKEETLSSLTAYLSAYAKEFLAKSGIVCRIEAPISYPEEIISAEVRNNLFSAVKEAINNAVRHGKPSQLSMQFAVGADRFEVHICDNGCGFDPQGVQRGHGLANLQERMQKIRGACQIRSAAPGGTTVILQLPLDPGADKSDDDP